MALDLLTDQQITDQVMPKISRLASDRGTVLPQYPVVLGWLQTLEAQLGAAIATARAATGSDLAGVAEIEEIRTAYEILGAALEARR